LLSIAALGAAPQLGLRPKPPSWGCAPNPLQGLCPWTPAAPRPNGAAARPNGAAAAERSGGPAERRPPTDRQAILPSPQGAPNLMIAGYAVGYAPH